MSIRVTCPGCHTRFNVSDQFAGQEGPCPKCKKSIKIPAASEEVVIHSGEDFGPKDQSGQAVLKPLIRKEAKLTPLGLTIVIVPIASFLVAALLSRFAFPDPQGFPIWLLIIGAIAIAIPCVLGAYMALRDQERGNFTGQELWTRVAICAIIYAFLWGAMPLMNYAFDGYGMFSWVIALVGMVALGGAVCMYTFEMDYLIGLLHVGMYITCALIIRFCAGVGALPGSTQPKTTPAPVEESLQVAPEGKMSYLYDCIQIWIA